MLLPALVCVLVVQFQNTQAQNLKPVFVNITGITAGTRIREDVQPDTVIATVIAVDPEGGTVTYSLDDQADEFFEINPSTGQITVKARLDYERTTTLRITVIATDSDGYATAYGSSFQIEDANDLEPYFKETYYNFNLKENTTVGHNITLLRVEDRDVSNNPISVTCDNNSTALARSCEVFGVGVFNRSTKDWNGFLFLQSPLDYEVEKSYSIRLIANDGIHRIQQEIQIGVLDVNDSPPTFVKASGIVIKEGPPVGSAITYVSAVDTDEVETRAIRYELTGNEEAKRYFSIDPVHGNITTLKPLDYEDPDRTLRGEFTLTIRARELLNNVSGARGNDSLTTAMTTITVRLTDVNDNCPTFDKESYSVSILENIAEGSNIPLQMIVTDADSGSHSSFDLQLDPSTSFRVTPTSGRSPVIAAITVVSNANIDYERPPRTLVLTVKAIENGPEAFRQNCSSSADVRITVEDVNDENPLFPQNSYSAEVKEDARERDIVTTITANDLDSGKFGTAGLRYSLLPAEQKIFTIDPVSGVVRTAGCNGTCGVAPGIDYEIKKRYDLAVQARDNEGVGGFLLATTQLTIDVLDVNDNSPRFTIPYTRSVYEGQTVTTDPLLIKALDPDGLSITYSIPSSQDEAWSWTIDPVTGNITALRPIQYSDLLNRDRGSFKFQAMASDGDFTDLVDITIIVIDVNDHSPEFFPQGNYTFSMAENAPYNTYIATITCGDGDAPRTGNGKVDISIDGGGFGKFTVQSNGTLNNRFLAQILTSSRAEFDYDTNSRYTLLVKARDRGNPSNTGTTYVIINILDVNNKNPYFDPPTASVSVLENLPVGNLVTTVTARDNDFNKQLQIQFRDPTRAFNPSGVEVTNRTLFQDLFSIDLQGNVRVKRRMDRDVVSFMSFTLFVEDISSDDLQNGTGTLFIRILEYNDQAPQFELPFYNLSVLEERPLSTFVGSILARDEDDQIRSYQLKSNPGNLFTISLTSGVLQVNGRLDYEMQHNVTLVVEAADSGSPSLRNTTTVFINIININDKPPIFNQTLYQIEMVEHSTRIDTLVHVSATDKDEGDYGEVRYSANDPYFRVDSSTGQIFLKPGADLDRETETTYSFQVTAYDSPNNASFRLNTTVPVYVALVDKNDNCPIFDTPAGYSGVVIETADVGDQVLEVFARDADAGINRLIKFTIDRDSAQPNAADLFFIQSIQSNFFDKESGRIEVRTSLRNKFGEYNFNVIASDMDGNNSTGEMCSTRVPVTVRVQEAINDAPIWLKPPSSNFSIEVLESQYRGMLVYDCQATDLNSGLAGIIDFSFNVQRNLTPTTSQFRINPITGVITAEVVFDREQVYSYVLTVVAKDRGDPPASSETVLIVNVLDVNDNDPEFPTRNGETIPYYFVVPEGTTPAEAGVIGVLSATDRDTAHKNNKVYYRVAAGNEDGLFSLNRETGELSLNPSRAAGGLDREQKEVYSMDVLAYNEVHDDTVIRARRKRSINPSIVTVNVTVGDLNDTPPRFTDTDYHGCVARDASFGMSIARVEAVDQDLTGASSVIYVKVSESTGDYFSVDNLGVIRNRKLLHDIGSVQPVVRIRADDNALADLGRSAIAVVKIFVTDTSNEVVVRVSQPSADVRAYKDHFIRVMKMNSSSAQNDIKYVCIREMRDRVNGDGTVSFTESDVVVSAVGQNEDGTYYIFASGDLRNTLLAQLDDEEISFFYRTLHVQDVVTGSESDEFELTEDPVLAIFIIAILLIFLAILLFCLACCLIRNSKKKKTKKLRAASEEMSQVEFVRQERPPEVLASVNPAYDNQGYSYSGDGDLYTVMPPAPVEPNDYDESEPIIITEPIEFHEACPPTAVGTRVNPVYSYSDDNDVYAVVQKPSQAPQQPPVVPVIIPAVEGRNTDDVYIVEPVPVEPNDYDEPEPIIITGPVVFDEPGQMAPSPDDDDVIDDEPVIETEVYPYDDIPEEPEDVIDVEFRDAQSDTSSNSSANSLPPPLPPTPPPVRNSPSPPPSPDVDSQSDASSDSSANSLPPPLPPPLPPTPPPARNFPSPPPSPHVEFRDSQSDASSYSPSDSLPPSPPRTRNSPSPPPSPETDENQLSYI
ncbi:cadherin-87A-like isoform X2 [Littorina saxatilis]|uniref:cadherin-87A-like isoform X2 n=1 Tax=Littorina saxatilis TaxID=31220 RepID=UPI0038B41C75